MTIDLRCSRLLSLFVIFTAINPVIAFVPHSKSSWHQKCWKCFSSSFSNNDKNNIQKNKSNTNTFLSSRSGFLQKSSLLFIWTVPILLPAHAFEGGIGGLGKTKPETGVQLWEGSAPMQNRQGIVSAELKGSHGTPILVEFQTPWPLLSTTSGLEARDLQQPESAFVQVVPHPKEQTVSDLQFAALVMDSVLGPQGKFGAYASPIDIKIKKLEDDLYTATFTTYTPAMRESERKLFLKVQSIEDDSLVLLVTGTTRARFKSQEETLRKVVDSFVAFAAPQSQRMR